MRRTQEGTQGGLHKLLHHQRQRLVVSTSARIYSKLPKCSFKQWGFSGRKRQLLVLPQHPSSDSLNTSQLSRELEQDGRPEDCWAVFCSWYCWTLTSGVWNLRILTLLCDGLVLDMTWLEQVVVEKCVWQRVDDPALMCGACKPPISATTRISVLYLFSLHVLVFAFVHTPFPMFSVQLLPASMTILWTCALLVCMLHILVVSCHCTSYFCRSDQWLNIV